MRWDSPVTFFSSQWSSCGLLCALLENSMASAKRCHTQKVAPGSLPCPGAICLVNIFSQSFFSVLCCAGIPPAATAANANGTNTKKLIHVLLPRRCREEVSLLGGDGIYFYPRDLNGLPSSSTVFPTPHLKRLTGLTAASVSTG